MREFLAILCMPKSGRLPVGIYGFKELHKRQTKVNQRKKKLLDDTENNGFIS
jgi:hypothetical protein